MPGTLNETIRTGTRGKMQGDSDQSVRRLDLEKGYPIAGKRGRAEDIHFSTETRFRAVTRVFRDHVRRSARRKTEPIRANFRVEVQIDSLLSLCERTPVDSSASPIAAWRTDDAI